MATHEQNSRWREKSGRIAVTWNLPVEVIVKLDEMVASKKEMVQQIESGEWETDMSRKEYELVKKIKGRPGMVSWLVMAGSAWDYAAAFVKEAEETANSEISRGWKNYHELYEVHEGNVERINNLLEENNRREEKLKFETQVAEEAERENARLKELLDAHGIDYEMETVK